MHEVVMPRIDPGMQTGFLVQWLKNEGDPVQKGETIAIGEGEKTTFDIVAPETGILRRQLYPPKSEVQVTEPIALIGEAGEEVPYITPKSGSLSRPSVASSKLEAAEELRAVSPAARRMAREQNIDLSHAKGTGPGGRITREDVLRLVSKEKPSVLSTTREATQPRVKEEHKLSSTRKTIADRLTYSHQIVPSAAIMMEVRMDPVIQLKARLESPSSPLSLSAFFVKALAFALSKDSAFNASIEGDVLRTYEDVNVAIAVQTPDGLVAPTILRASEKTLQEISAEITTLTEKAKARKLDVKELTGSTVTISNLGPQGVDAFVPIINPPNAAILGVGRISERPEVVEGKITHVNSVATLTLVFDHRVNDGIAASHLLGSVKRLLEASERLTQ